MGFRLSRLPPAVQATFKKGPSAWREATLQAIGLGSSDPNQLADIAFFIRHPERVNASGEGKAIDPKESGFVKVRAEWELYLTIVSKMLNPSIKPSVFLPEIPSPTYEGFIAAQTTGLTTLMVNGRNSDGSGHKTGGNFDGFKDSVDSFNEMQRAVESLRAGDSLFVANWQFAPESLLLTATPVTKKNKSWGDLLAGKAGEGVKIRVIIAQHPFGSPFMTNLDALNNIITPLPKDKRDNFKYIVSAHPSPLGVHHQKFMVARAAKSTVAFCGGLDISFNRAPPWPLQFVWHDICAKLEGKITHDLEREFIAHWNRDRTKSSAKPVEGWKAMEPLSPVTASKIDLSPSVNKHSIQMVRTLSTGPDPLNIQRDDIWRAYFRLIGRATRFIYLEDQYFQTPDLADAIVRQAESQSELIVMVMVGTGTDDRQTVDPKATGLDRVSQIAAVDATQDAFALRLEFFKRLSVAPLLPDRLRIYTLNYASGILHSKFMLVDDEALTVGSANGNPRGFFLDTETNVVLDNPDAARSFRHRLWGHNLGIAPEKVADWRVSQFFERWDAVASSNQGLSSTPEKLSGEGVIPFKPLDPKDPRFRAGKWGPIHTPLGDIKPQENLF